MFLRDRLSSEEARVEIVSEICYILLLYGNSPQPTCFFEGGAAIPEGDAGIRWRVLVVILRQIRSSNLRPDRGLLRRG